MNQLKEYLIWIVLGIPGMVLIGLVLHSLVHFETGVLIIASMILGTFLMLPLVSSNRTNALAPFSLSTMISLKHLPPSLFCKILPLILIRPLRFSPCFC